MKKLFPEPKKIQDNNGYTHPFKSLSIQMFNCSLSENEVLKIAKNRFWNYPDINICLAGDGLSIKIFEQLDISKAEKPELFKEQGYELQISNSGVAIYFAERAGLVNALTSTKQLLEQDGQKYKLPLCEILDYPSIKQRAVSPTFSWYAGYGRIGFDMQLWGEREWVEYLNCCLDSKINQMNMVMYGYWPFIFDKYPETTFKDIPVKIWNAENKRWLKIHYTHPNIEENYLGRFIDLAHSLGVKIFAYVGLNSYNGGYSIKHPEKRMKTPKDSNFMNDFDSLCLSDDDNVTYIIDSMKKIAKLGFDGYALEESEEGFWFCECEKCKKRWHAVSKTPGEAKHKANMWLLRLIYDECRKVNPDIKFGIRAFRQPPLEKDPEFLKECVDSLPKDVVLFWAPALYVPPTEFEKWIAAFGKERICGRDSESNSITSTMGRLYRIFKSNVIRYEDESNVQVIETDIEQHITSVEKDVCGINGFMFEWFGYFMHQWAHGNYGWGSKMDMEEFFIESCRAEFGRELGDEVLYVLKNIVTIHESQMPFYKTPFPFQKNKITEQDIPAIEAAKANHANILGKIDKIQNELEKIPHLRHYLPHFDKIRNAERRNRVIYDMVLASLRYEKEKDPIKKDAILDEILYYNEKDFDIAKEMFFDINPVKETGVSSCMFPYHEIKREIHNIRHPEDTDDDVICSGVEAFGWLWL